MFAKDEWTEERIAAYVAALDEEDRGVDAKVAGLAPESVPEDAARAKRYAARKAGIAAERKRAQGMSSTKRKPQEPVSA
ncbi:MAG: hypothetical protein FJ033_10940 [Chloroflexi bacterium]|nr:hypothetical protein [Chloroflexota bacterium]